jgi:hypothetical protein
VLYEYRCILSPAVGAVNVLALVAHALLVVIEQHYYSCHVMIAS